MKKKDTIIPECDMRNDKADWGLKFSGFLWAVTKDRHLKDGDLDELYITFKDILDRKLGSERQ